MSGNRYVLVRDAIVALVQGNSQLIQLLQNADWIGVSVINQIEFVAFSGLSQDDRQLFELFLQRVEIIGLVASDAALIEKITKVPAISIEITGCCYCSNGVPKFSKFSEC